MHWKDLKSLAQYCNGVYCMGTSIRCIERPLCFIVIITHRARYTEEVNNWVRMHDNLQLWGGDCDVASIRDDAVICVEDGDIDNFYVLKALFAKEEPCQV